MVSFIYDKKLGELVPAVDFYYQKYLQKSHLHMTVGNKKVEIYYNSDEMAPTRHMVNGKYYTSKKKFRNETKARGCIEVGNDTKSLLTSRKFKSLDRRQRRDDIKKAIWELRNGRKA